MLYFFIILSAVMLSLKGVFAKLALNEGMSVDVILFYRYALAFPLAWLVAKIMLRSKPLLSMTRKELIIFGISSIISYYLGNKADFTAVDLLGASVSRLILYTYPAFVVLINAIMARKLPTKQQLLILGLVQIGLFFTVYQFGLDVSITSWQGLIIGLGASLAFASYILTVQTYGQRIPSISIIAYAVTVGGLASALDLIITSPLAFNQIIHEFYVAPKALAWIGCMAVFSTFVPLLIFAEAIKRIGGNESAIVSAVGPFITIIFAYFLLGETMELSQIAGGILIIYAIFLLSKSDMKRHKEKA